MCLLKIVTALLLLGFSKVGNTPINNIILISGPYITYVHTISKHVDV